MILEVITNYHSKTNKLHFMIILTTSCRKKRRQITNQLFRYWFGGTISY